MTTNSELTRQQFSNCLWTVFQQEGKSKEQCSEYSDKFDRLTDTNKVSPSTAFQIIYSSYGACDAKDVLNQVGRFIHNNLEDFSKVAPKVKLNSKTRLADTIARFNKNLGHLASISINNVSLTAEEIEALKIPVPANVTTESFASDQTSKVKNLALEITK